LEFHGGPALKDQAVSARQAVRQEEPARADQVVFSGTAASGISPANELSRAPLDPPFGTGTSLDMDHADQSPEANSLPVQGPHLRLCGEPSEEFVPLRLVLQPTGAMIAIDRPDVLVGRHTEADIRLPLPDVSRRHCRLQFIAGCWQVVDLKSLNGIHVNGEQVLQAPLEQGDLLRIGGFTFAIDLTGKASAVNSPLQSIFQSLTLQQERRAS
jgi:hypothetical protein